MRTPPPSFFASLDDIGIELAPPDIARLARFLGHLIETSETRFNLTAIRDWETAWQKHILDSLTLLPILDGLTEYEIGMADADHDESDDAHECSVSMDGMHEPSMRIGDVDSDSAGEHPRLVDVGSGGGLPGIPIALARPEMRMTLVETTGKKARFLDECVELLDLGNVSVLNRRAEQVGQTSSPHRDSFDIALARALGPLHVSLELTIPLIHIGGHAIFIRGQSAARDVRDAARAAKLLRATHLDTVATPTGQIVIYEKEHETPKKYPRRPGEPKANPLR